MFNTDHLILTIAWIAFCVLHSLLANEGFKRRVEKASGPLYRFYRPAYSVFAFLNLAIILYLQFSTRSTLLWKPNLLTSLLAIPFLAISLYIMGLSISKYFFYLSGVDVLMNKTVEPVLQTGGLHRFVRHPLYLGTIMLVWCIFLYFPYFSHLIACLIITLYSRIGIVFEEKKLVKEYGDQYKQYAKKVPMLIPDFKRK